MSVLSVVCPDEIATMQVAVKIAGLVESGGFIELIGDVGVGKTTFVKGLAKGLGYEEDVSSPSFALKNVYKGKISINHFDLYRLSEPGLIRHELAEAIADEGSLVVVEWASDADDILPEKRIKVNFKVLDEASRELTIILPGEK